MNEDYSLDMYLEEMYEDRYPAPYVDDAEEFELNQLALDNDGYDPYDEYDEPDDLDWWTGSDDYDDGPEGALVPA